ncbi:MAG: hypothetical protein IT439_03455 [Phycisphaerales bacterium]|nr:hypothetical protein [Phycisphaerales bacterium]
MSGHKNVWMLAALAAALSAAGASGQLTIGGFSYGNSHMGFRGATTTPSAPFAAPGPVSRPTYGNRYCRVYPVYTGSALTVNGRYRDDNWNIGVHLGSGFEGYPDSGCDDWRSPACVPPYWPTYCTPGYTIFPGGYLYEWDRRGYSQPVEYAGTVYDPRLGGGRPVYAAPQPAPPPATALERARLALAQNNAGEAVKEYKAHMAEFATDTVGLRELGFALIGEGRMSEGVAVIREAYAQRPALADEPVDLSVFGPEGVRIATRLARRVSTYANQGQGSSDWLALCVLLQAQDRDRMALHNLVKAVENGLESEIAVPLGDALRRRAYAGQP